MYMYIVFRVRFIWFLSFFPIKCEIIVRRKALMPIPMKYAGINFVISGKDFKGQIKNS